MIIWLDEGGCDINFSEYVNICECVETEKILYYIVHIVLTQVFIYLYYVAIIIFIVRL